MIEKFAAALNGRSAICQTGGLRSRVCGYLPVFHVGFGGGEQARRPASEWRASLERIEGNG